MEAFKIVCEPIAAGSVMVVSPELAPRAGGLDSPLPIYVVDGLDPGAWYMVSGAGTRKMFEGLVACGAAKRL